MTFEEFKAWCNERACDGCWSARTAMFCGEVIRQVRKKPFWRRERRWQEMNKELSIENRVVNHINAKIEAIQKKQKEAEPPEGE